MGEPEPGWRLVGPPDLRTGKALCAPVCVDLRTYPVQLRNGDIYVRVPG